VRRTPSFLPRLRSPGRAKPLAWASIVALLCQLWLAVPLGAAMQMEMAEGSAAPLAHCPDEGDAHAAHEGHRHHGRDAAAPAPAAPAKAPAGSGSGHGHDHARCQLCQTASHPLAALVVVVAMLVAGGVEQPISLAAALPPRQAAALPYQSRAPPLS